MSILSGALARVPLLSARGIGFHEKMSGYHKLLEGKRAGERLRFAFEAGAKSRTVPDFFGVDGGAILLDGDVEAEGIAVRAPMKGTIRMNVRAKVGVMTYDFEFKGDDGATYRFHGIKNREGLIDTLYGKTIRADTGVIVSEGITRFDYSGLFSFLRSFTLARAG